MEHGPHSLPALRHRYARGLRLARAAGYSPAAVNAAVQELVGNSATPLEYVAALEVARLVCNACNGRGTWHGSSVANNGGPCYRCAGTGRQGIADWARNVKYDRYIRGKDCPQ
jgi:hypothetical protein